MGVKMVGARVKRLEDPRLLRGEAAFVDDLKLSGMVHMAILRSPYGHARINAIDISQAREAAGVVDAFTVQDFGSTPPAIPALVPHPALKPCPQFPLANGVVRYVGEGLAVVIAESRHLAEDALELIDVDYEPLPAFGSAEAAMAPGATLLHPDAADNVCAAWTDSVGDTAAAFAAADVVVSERLTMQRYTGVPMETRGVIAAVDPITGELTIWNSTQWPHTVKSLVAALLGIPEQMVRVVMPDIGGGFGIKVDLYPEDVLVPFAARRVRRPVKWIEDRREHMLSAIHAREQVHDVELALRRDGTIIALRDRVITDMGAYVRTLGIINPSLGAASLPGAYKIPNVTIESICVLTNKAPVSPYRGAGQPEAAYIRERIVDIAAHTLGMDPAELRRRNLVTPSDIPYTTGLASVEGPVILDSGDYPAAFEKALELIGYWELRRAQDSVDAPRLRGVGICVYPQVSGQGPFEGATVSVDTTGKVRVVSGVAPQGQGTLTTLAQIVADELSIPVEDITGSFGDTGRIGYGVGTFASRNAVMAGTAVREAAINLRNKAARLAAHLLEANADEIEFQSGAAQVRGVPSRSLTWGQIAQASAPGGSRPNGMEPGLTSSHYFETHDSPYSHAVHVAVAEIDPATGVTRIGPYAVVNDAGRIINPLLAEGQIHGGVAQGLGGALLEELTYDHDAQMTAVSFLDYLMPSSVDVPNIMIEHMESPSPLNPLGVKGMGEGGAIGAHAAVANAVADAIRQAGGATVTRTPLTPDVVWSLCHAEDASDGVASQ